MNTKKRKENVLSEPGSSKGNRQNLSKKAKSENNAKDNFDSLMNDDDDYLLQVTQIAENSQSKSSSNKHIHHNANVNSNNFYGSSNQTSGRKNRQTRLDNPNHQLPFNYQRPSKTNSSNRAQTPNNIVERNRSLPSSPEVTTFVTTINETKFHNDNNSTRSSLSKLLIKTESSQRISKKKQSEDFRAKMKIIATDFCNYRKKCNETPVKRNTTNKHESENKTSDSKQANENFNLGELYKSLVNLEDKFGHNILILDTNKRHNPFKEYSDSILLSDMN